METLKIVKKFLIKLTFSTLSLPCYLDYSEHILTEIALTTVIVSCILFIFQVGSDVYLCYKKSMAKANMVAYQPGKLTWVVVEIVNFFNSILRSIFSSLSFLYRSFSFAYK